jgi:methylthioribose-1-phosphate isomerase
MMQTHTGHHDTIRAVEWRENGVRFIDQRLLPQRLEYITAADAAAVAQAIQDMVVRGAPAIGVAAAYGVALAARDAYRRQPTQWAEAMKDDMAHLGRARPTAVNLTWALQRMGKRCDGLQGDPFPQLLEEARLIHEEDIAANHRMGELGSALIGQRCAVLTHCNTGSLATGGYGTALGVIRTAYGAGRISHVYAGETRPWLQGARLTAWELVQDGIPVSLIADGAVSHLLRQGEVGWVIVGADRIAANGDVANKIGTYNAAVAARYHGVKMMVVAPTSTIDSTLATGAQIPIERRDAEEILSVSGRRVAAEGAQAWNPVFDITPASLVDAIVTENGVVLAPDTAKMATLMASGSQ